MLGNFLGGQNTLGCELQCYSWVGSCPPCPLGSRAFESKVQYLVFMLTYMNNFPVRDDTDCYTVQTTTLVMLLLLLSSLSLLQFLSLLSTR